MQPLYEQFENDLELFHMNTHHVPPHMHKLVEIAYVTDGTLEIGIGEDIFHMEKGDLAIVFPDVVHHYQVFGEGPNRASFLIVSKTYCDAFSDLLTTRIPTDPVLPAAKVHPDVRMAMDNMLRNFAGEINEDHYRRLSTSSVPYADIILRSFIQILLARTLPLMTFTDKDFADSHDLVYQVVSYISAHSAEPVTLTGMARDLLVTPNALSRVFSGTFHTNFNAYLNNVRLEQAANLLKYTDLPIGEALLTAGFESQRTFNRVFTEKYHMSPREYRRKVRDPQTMEASLHRVL